jgi:ABC-type multidrug transport system ATPase subunit
MLSSCMVNVGLKTIDHFGKVSVVLKDVNLCFSDKDRIGLIGMNGTGKSSLLSILIGHLNPTEGTCKVSPARSEITMMLQRPEEHFLHGSVGEQVHSYCRRGASYDKIIELLNAVGLPEACVRMPPLRLSTGQQRLIAIACAIGSGARFLLLDEPMAGLDATGRVLVRKALMTIAEQRDLGWVIVSHHPDDLLGLIDRLWVLEKCGIVYDGPFTDIPVNILVNDFPPTRNSLFTFLRQLELNGLILPKKIYNYQDIQLVAEELKKVMR